MSLITDISRQAAKAANTLALLDTETKKPSVNRNGCGIKRARL